MAGLTNKGASKILKWAFQTAKPSTHYVALCTDATAPNADHNTFSQLTEIAAGNGYTSGGALVTANATGFDTVTEDDSLDQGRIQLADVSWVATGGTMPGSGNGALYAVLLDGTIATVASREIISYWTLSTARSTPNGETLLLQDLEMVLKTA